MSPLDLVFLLLFGGVMWFLLIKPQMDEKRAHDELVASLAKDDEVVTSSGLHGRVTEVRGDTVILEVAEKTRLTLDKTAVARRAAGEKK